VFVLSMILVSATVLGQFGPTSGRADAACGIAYVAGCPTTTSAHSTHSTGHR
jgi:hypothetical protein